MVTQQPTKVPAQTGKGVLDSSPEELDDPTAANTLDTAPCLTVLGHTASGDSVAVRLGWRRGMVIISNSRLKFIREELEMNVVDDPAAYLI